MELLGLVDFPLWILFVICAVFLIYKYSVYPYSVWKECGIDGPAPVPFFGNLLKIYDPKIGSRSCIDTWKKQYGKAFGVYFMRKPFLVVTDLDMLKQVFVKDFHNFADRHIVADGKIMNEIVRKSLFFENGADWLRIRRVMTPTFSSAKLKHLFHHINKTARDLSDYVQKNAIEQTPIDAKDFFGAFALDVIAGIAFGLDINSQQNFDLPFIKNAKSLMTFKKLNQLKVLLGGIFPPITPLFKFFDIGFFNSENCHYFEKSIYSLISQRKGVAENDKTSDFLQMLLNAEADENSGISDSERKLSSQEVAGQCILFIIAGYETTSTTLQYIAYELARHRSIQEKVQEEIQQVVGDVDDPTYEQLQNLKYMTAVMSETLRMYPPFNMVNRQTVRACTLGDLSLPANVAVLIPVYNIGRDPANFEDPNEFKPERFLDNDSQSRLNDVSFLPFGFGPRHCIGQRLAMMELKLALVQMLRKVTIHDASPKELKLQDFSGLLVPAQPIKLSVQLR